MKKVFVYSLLSTLIGLPVYAADLNTTGQPAAAAAQPAAQPAAAAQPIAQPKSTGVVARAQFTSEIQDREPVDKVSNLINDKNRIYYFSEIKDASNQKLTHRWEHNGKVMSETSFDIGGDRWRVYSNKTLDPNQTGLIRRGDFAAVKTDAELALQVFYPAKPIVKQDRCRKQESSAARKRLDLFD